MEAELGLVTFQSIVKIAEASLLFAFMIIVEIALCWFIMYLMKELKASRQESTAALVDNTKILIELKEVVKNALDKKTT